MGKSLNKWLGIGNVGKDPEIRETASGMLIANFTLATSDRKKDAEGNWQDAVEWHNLTAFKRTAEIVRDYVHKGSKLYIEGKLQTQSWEKDGVKHYKTVILVNDLGLLDGKPQGGTVSQQPAQEEISEDSIPF